MKKRTLTPGALLAPLPAVLVSCGTCEESNIITVAWTGIVNSKPPMTYISLRPERYSHKIISERREFVINLPNRSLTERVDWCGMKTGSRFDKFSYCGFQKEKAEGLADCPAIADCPVQLSCRVKQILPLGSHEMFLAEIVSVQADDGLFDRNGKLHLERAELIGYAHGAYVPVGRPLGSFGFSVRKGRKS